MEHEEVALLEEATLNLWGLGESGEDRAPWIIALCFRKEREGNLLPKEQIGASAARPSGRVLELSLLAW
jgi:hypothetical protein